MLKRGVLALMALMVMAPVAGAEVFVGSDVPERSLGIVQNRSFESGGRSYADHWRPLPGAARMHRTKREGGEHSLFLELRETGDGGVVQTVDLPAHHRLSLRVLATCHADADCAVVVTLTRVSDGVILTELSVDGIERGVLAENFGTGPGGPAELMVRVVGAEGGRALIDRVTIAGPVEARHARSPDYSGPDLMLARGAGLRVEADFEPSLLPQAARMLQEAIEDVTGAPTTSIGAEVLVHVDQPESPQWPERESYHLKVSESGVAITAPAEQGAVWAMMTLIDLVRPEPDGGTRVLAVDVRDEPALPWRAVSAVRGQTPTNFARAAARLKFNVAEIDPSQPEASAMARELTSLGIEPLVRLGAETGEDIKSAMRKAVDRLGARYLLILPPKTDGETEGAMRPHRWDQPPLSDVAQFAREHPDSVTVIVPASRRVLEEKQLGSLRHEAATSVQVTPVDWPAEVVALLPRISRGEGDFDHQRWFDAGIPSVLRAASDDEPLSVHRALQARANGHQCLGVWMSHRICGGSVWEREFTRRAADLAWRGLTDRHE